MPPAGQNASSSAAYRPTSLDFINLPNPIEPHTQAQKHPLNGTPRLEKARLEGSTNQDLFKLILEPCNERPPKRQKATDNNTLLDLPKLPVRNSAKRLRIPPTLSGLHQPPPDAGLLPSISVEQPQVPPPRPQDVSASQKPHPIATKQSSTTRDESSTTDQASRLTQPRPKRNKWTESETADLLKGVAKFGMGNWTKILNCTEYTFHRRTALDLKDRFRVCCPEHYTSQKKNSLKSAVASIEADVEEEPASPDDNKKMKGPASERMSTSQLKDLGIEEPFAKSGRRSRHGYSEAEDAAILRGFQKYGKSWSSIRKDKTLDLSGRKPRDLRDRMRTRYPEEYAKAGLALPAEKGGGTKRGGGEEVSPANDEPSPTATAPAPPPPITKRHPPQHSIFTLDDVFLPNHFDHDEDTSSEPIILDRGILDWAPPRPPHSSGINPLMTLKLPKPVSQARQNLPSLAELLPNDGGGEGVELPSLGSWVGTGDEGRSALTLEELMS